MAPKNRFVDGEKVLCFHGPLLYEAKVIKSQVKGKDTRYMVHYSGWNKNWDEWVPETRILKCNEANQQKQRDLAAAHSSSQEKGKKAKSGKGNSLKKDLDRESSALPPQEKTPKEKKCKDAASSSTPSTSSTETQAELMQKKKRSRAEMNVETEEECVHKMEVKVRIPDELKYSLIDDWNMICTKKKLPILPARVTVEDIIQDYVRTKVSIKGTTKNKEAMIVEVTNGLKEYFNVMLPKQLLYKQERQRHSELAALHTDKTPEQLYGGIHLLRLFTKIGGSLAYSTINEEQTNFITTNFYDFMKYMSRSPSTLFNSSEYAEHTESAEVMEE